MLIIKGIIIGIGKIIPGVSGSMLAISMGIYQKLIDGVNNIFKYSKENIIFLFKISIGIILSIVFFSNIILNLLNNYYIFTMSIFIGFILGGNENIKNNIIKKDKYISYIVFVILILISLISINNNINSNINFIFIGFIEAITMIVPGISGTATLMMLGCYNKVIEMYSNILNFNLFIENLKLLIPFSIGLVIGIIITIKTINYLFKNYKSKTYSAILGFYYSTLFIMIIKTIKFFNNINQIILSIILFLIGLLMSKKINHYFND